MRISAHQLINLPIISLQTGETVALAHRPVFDMGSLRILAFHCILANQKRHLLLLARDIRQFAEDCIIIDNENELTEPEDIIRMQQTLQANYTPLGKSVVSESSARIGTVDDYTMDIETARVQTLHLHGSFLRSWIGRSLIIDRSQIVDITPRHIIVRDATVTSPSLSAKPLPESQP